MLDITFILCTLHNTLSSTILMPERARKRQEILSQSPKPVLQQLIELFEYSIICFQFQLFLVHCGGPHYNYQIIFDYFIQINKNPKLPK